MVSRRGYNRQTLVEKVAAGLDPELLDLRPFLADGVAGWRRYNTLLRAALVVDGGSEDDVPELLEEIGVETANAYRVMLGRRPVL
jgi:hypothetical protein